MSTATTLEAPTTRIPIFKPTERFQLLHGSHFHPTGTFDERGQPVMKQYRRGEVIESDSDLCDVYNPKDRNGTQIRGDERFARVSEVIPTIINDTVQRSDESLAEWAHRLSELAKNASTLVAEQTKKQDTMLESMDVKELKALAEEEEIDLKGQLKKEEIIKTIRSMRSTLSGK